MSTNTDPNVALGVGLKWPGDDDKAISLPITVCYSVVSVV